MTKFIIWCFLVLSTAAFAQSRAIDSLRSLIKNAPNREVALKEKSLLATRLFAAGEAKAAAITINEALSEATALNDDLALGHVYKSAGNLQFYENRLDSALACYKKASVFFEKAGDLEGTAKILSNIGNISGMRGDVAGAQEYYRQALLTEEKLGVPEGTYVPLNNIAVLYRRMNIAPKAIHYFRKAEKINQERGALAELSTSYDGLARMYTDLGKFDSAMNYARKARSLAEQIRDLPGYTYALTNLGSVHHGLKQYDSSIWYLREALPYTKMIRDIRLEFATLANLAAAFVLKNNTDSALHYIDLAMPLQNEVNLEDYEQDLSYILAEYYYRKGDYKKAYDYGKKHAMMRDSSYQVEVNSRIAEMQEVFETKKKERENRLLQLENKSYRDTRNYLLVILSLAGISIVIGLVAYIKIRKANALISSQKELVEESRKEILDSINYARRIQFALLSSHKLLESNLPEHFVLFKPKAVVSGDFYWASPTGDGFMLIAGDCTGHGVPGAFMSLLNITKLSQVINEQNITRPDLVLNKVREEIIHVLNPEGSSDESRDGMDAVLCKFKLRELKLEFAAANNSLYIVRNKEIIICKPDKMPVGRGHDDSVPFTFNEVALQKGDLIYMFTDGFADQFGGPHGKKFKYKQLEKLLVSISHESMEKQKELLDLAFENWRGDQEQVDDLCLIGVRV